MILKSIRLKNFISHRDSKIEFPLGVVAIIGPNGAGKTSILDAISFALFKDTSRGKTYENLLHRGVNVAEVELEFIHNNRLYRLYRKISKVGKRIGVASKLYVDGKLKMFGEREVDKEIERILGVDKNLFSSTIYIRQGEIERLVTARPHERKELMSKLLRIHDLERAWKEMLSIIKVYEERLRGIENELKRRSELKEKLESKRKNLKELIEELVHTERELNAYEKKLAEIKETLEEYNRKRDIFINIKVRLDEIAKKEKDIHINLEEYKREYELSLKAKKKVNEMEKRLKALDVLNEYKVLLDRLGILEEQLELLRRQLNEYREIAHKLHTLELILKKYSMLKYKLPFIESKIREENMLRERILSIEKTLRDYDHFLEGKREQLKHALARIGLSEKFDLKTIHSKHSDLMKKLSMEEHRLVKSISDITRTIGVLEYKMNYVEQLKHTIATSKKCPICESSIEDKVNKIINRLELERKHTLSFKQEMEKKLKEIEEYLERVRGKIKDIISTPIDTIDRTLHEISELQSKKEVILKEMSQIKCRLEEIYKWRYIYEELSPVIGEIEATHYEYNILMKKLENVPNPIDLVSRINELELERETTIKRMSLLETKYHIDPGSIDTKLSELFNLKEQYEQLIPIASKTDLLRKLIEENINLRSQLKREKEELERKLELLDYDEGVHSKLLEERKSIEDKAKTLAMRVSSLKTRIDSLRREIEELEEEWRNIKKLEQKYIKLSKLVEMLKEIRALYSKDQLQRDIRNIAKPIIENYTREYFKCFGLDYYDVKLDEDFNIYLIGHGGIYSVSAISGGERMALSLALRMAIAKALTGESLSFMMMDEPTVHLDEVRRRQLTTMIRRGVRHRGLSQLIVVTHDRELEDVADVVYRVQKSGVFSTVTRV